MREILFRGKTEHGGWIHGSLIKTGYYCCILEDDDGTDNDYPHLDELTGFIDGYATPVYPDTVGQFTGLTDKNGKKIFEGDIVEGSWGRGAVCYGEFNCSCCDGVYGWYFDNGEDIRRYDYYEVIGNIHDNPELLEVSK